MKNNLPNTGPKSRWIWLLAGLIGILITVWLLLTPGGLLGKADAIGYAVCHRIDLRSFHLGDRQIPLCARCTGMYLGAVLGLVYQAIQGKRTAMPPWKILGVFALFAVAFGVDGVNSYLHFFPEAPSLYQPENWLRLLTGTGIGLGMAAVLMPVFHQTLWRNWDNRAAIGSWRKLGGLLVLAGILDLAILSENPLILYPLALISSAGVIILLTMVYTIVWLMILRLENRFDHISQLLVPILAGLLVAFTQIAVMDLGRYLLTHTWGGFQL